MIGLFTKEQPAFGLDLSDISIKVCQFQKTKGEYKIIGYGDYDLPKGVIVNDVIMDEQALIRHVNSFLPKIDFGKLTTKDVVCSIPESKAFVRVIQIPKMSQEAAESAVPFEAEQYIPIPLDQAYLDWQIIKGYEEKMDVLVTASPKDFIDNFLNFCKRAGLRPVSFEVESAAVSRAILTPERKGRDILILDMDTFRTSLIVVSNGFLQFTSSIPIAGDALTQSIARALAISPEQAEKTKREVGLDEAKEFSNVKNAMVPVIDNIVSEIENIIKFHNEHSANKISEIVLCGGTAKLLHLTSYLYQKLTAYNNIDIVLANPWVNVFPNTKHQPPLTREDSLSFTTAIGLALRGAEEK